MSDDVVVDRIRTRLQYGRAMRGMEPSHVKVGFYVYSRLDQLHRESGAKGIPTVDGVPVYEDEYINGSRILVFYPEDGADE